MKERRERMEKKTGLKENRNARRKKKVSGGGKRRALTDQEAIPILNERRTERIQLRFNLTSEAADTHPHFHNPRATQISSTGRRRRGGGKDDGRAYQSELSGNAEGGAFPWWREWRRQRCSFWLLSAVAGSLASPQDEMTAEW